MPIALWIGFIVFIFVMLAIDLLVFHRKSHEVSLKEALIWSGIWIALSLFFNAGIYFWFGRQAALEFFAGYLIEKSLSMDNLFVFLLIFSYFKVPQKYQHGVLFWGILGALLMRAGFIAGGIALIENFHWIIYVFGAFLIFTGIKLALENDKEIHPERNIILRLFRKIMPITKDYEEDKFFIKRAGQWMATPLLVVLLIVETTDIIFAVDSIPAILAITQKPFIVYSSNVFAILGLRALYFALAGLMRYFHYLHYGLSVILVFVGVKMLLTDIFKIPIGMSLGIITGVLLLSVLASMVWPKKEKKELVTP